MPTYEDLDHVIEQSERLVAGTKSHMETILTQTGNYDSIITFYDQQQRISLLVGLPQNLEDAERYEKISEALHIYAAGKYSAVLIPVIGKYNREIGNDIDQIPTLNIFILSFHHAYFLINPFIITNGIFEWLEEESSINEIENYEFDDYGKDIVTMFYHFTHLENSIHTLEEIKSYLTFNKFTVVDFNENALPFVDFTSPEMSSSYDSLREDLMNIYADS